MIDTEWFQGRQVDEHDLSYWGRISAELACLFLVGVIVAGLQGCATKKEEATQVCFIQFLGKTDGGLSVVRQACFTEEQFAEMQK